MDVGKVLKNGWDLFVKDIGPLIVAALVPGVVMFIGIIIAYVAFLIPVLTTSNDGEASTGAVVGGSIAVAIVVIVAIVLTIPFYGAIVRMVLRRVREGRPAQYGDIWSCWDQWFSLVVAIVVVGLLVGLGFVFFIVPGVILATMWVFVLPIIVDRRVGLGEAMGMSWELVKRVGFWTVLLNLVVVAVIAALVSQVPLAGLLVGAWELAAVTAMYLMATGEERLLPSSFPGPASAWQGGEPPQYGPYGPYAPYGPPGGQGFVPYGPPPAGAPPAGPPAGGGPPYVDPQPYAANYGPPPWAGAAQPPAWTPPPGQGQPAGWAPAPGTVPPALGATPPAPGTAPPASGAQPPVPDATSPQVRQPPSAPPAPSAAPPAESAPSPAPEAAPPPVGGQPPAAAGGAPDQGAAGPDEPTAPVPPAPPTPPA